MDILLSDIKINAIGLYNKIFFPNFMTQNNSHPMGCLFSQLHQGVLSKIN